MDMFFHSVWSRILFFSRYFICFAAPLSEAGSSCVSVALRLSRGQYMKWGLPMWHGGCPNVIALSEGKSHIQLRVELVWLAMTGLAAIAGISSKYFSNMNVSSNWTAKYLMCCCCVQKWIWSAEKKLTFVHERERKDAFTLPYQWLQQALVISACAKSHVHAL